MRKTFFIADTHFGHSNIIKYENRPFKDNLEMDAKLIRNWNNVVKKEHQVFVLGDFSFHGADRTKEICTQLNGDKFLILGNHDGKSPKHYLECGFKECYKYPIIFDGFWILSHEPLYVNSNMPYANIFGHVHSNPIYKDYGDQSFCVSVERIGYAPIAFDKIKELLACEDPEKQNKNEGE